LIEVLRFAVVDYNQAGRKRRGFLAGSGVGLLSLEVERIVEAAVVGVDVPAATAVMQTKTKTKTKMKTKMKMKMIKRIRGCGWRRKRFVECFPIPRTGPLNLSRTRKPWFVL
jgi:hypothetical protein